MADREYFEQLLSEEYRDPALCWMFGDWLAERGDPAADVYYWQGRHFKRPAKAMATWDWWNEDSNNPEEIRLPTELWRLIEKQAHASWQNCKEFPTRQAADEALRKALRESAAPCA